ncbi:MAG: helix-turn-helix domain-containing protein [Spirochaetales bacterium]|nr:helix-turn-helix domain-containing protein [Spirochaetales bacterium]
MEKMYYSVDEAAEILNLHPRTVRIYIREGKLMGRKIGKEWRIPRTALNAFLGEGTDATEKPVETEDFLKTASIRISAIIDIHAASAERATRISTMILAALKGKGREYNDVRFDFIYYESERKARCLLWGDPAFIGNLLVLLGRAMD